jgi:hypothetical protein
MKLKGQLVMCNDEGHKATSTEVIVMKNHWQRLPITPHCHVSVAIVQGRCDLLRGDGAHGARLIQSQHHAFGHIQLVVHPVLADITRHEILANDELADPWVDEHTALDGSFVDPVLTEATEMLELEHISPGIASKEAIVQGWRESKSVGAAKVLCIQGIHGGEDIVEGLIGVSPVTPIVMGPALSGQQPL